MSALKRILSGILPVVGLLVCASAANAQATRTWVSGVGDDVNPCSRTAPCKTFAGAISKTAAKGQINVLDPGAYGALTITKSITVDASENFAGVLATLNTSGIIINAASTDIVTLRGLTIDGAGTGANGVRVLSAAQVHIENCTIQNFVNRGIEIANSAANTNVFVRNTVVKNNFSGGGVPAGNSGGILVKPSGGFAAVVTLDNVNVDQNFFGLRAENNTRVIANRSTFSGNTQQGVIAISTGVANSVTLEHSMIVNNTTGVHSEGAAAAVRLSNNVITGNGTGIAASTGAVISFSNNTNNGNGTNGAATQTLTQN